MRVAVRGGPFDGSQIPTAGRFRWVSDRGGHSAPAPGRALYRATPLGYEYVGENTLWCPSCQAAVKRISTRSCTLCGRDKLKPAFWPLPEEEMDGGEKI